MPELDRRTFPIAVTGDTHIGSPTLQGFTLDEWGDHFEKAGKIGRVINHTGDLSQDGKLVEAEDAAKILDRSEAPVLVTLGNHDYRSPDLSRFKAIISEPSNVYLLDDLDYFLLEDSDEGRESVFGFVAIQGIGGGFGHSSIGNGLPYDQSYYTQVMERQAQALRYKLHQTQAARNIVSMHYPPSQSRRAFEQKRIHEPLETTIDAFDNVVLVLHGHFHEDVANHQTPGGKLVRNTAKDHMLTLPGSRPFGVIYEKFGDYRHLPSPVVEHPVYYRVAS